MVNDCIQYDISKWGNSSHKLKKTPKNHTISRDNTNYTIALKEEEKQNCIN